MEVSTKEDLINTIKEWIKIDTEIARLKAETKDRNKKKKLLTENLVKTMKTNEIDCFDINGGSLVYKRKTLTKPITGKLLLEQLQEFYKDSPDVAKEIVQKVLDNRVKVIKDVIERKIDK